MASSVGAPEKSPPAILIVDDDDDFRRLLVAALQPEDLRLVEAPSAAQARDVLARDDFDVVITDLNMPGEDGLELLRWGQRQRPGPDWIVLTGYGTYGAAVTALQLGAFDFLSKPLRSLEPLHKSLRNALGKRRLQQERDRIRAELEVSNTRLREHVAQLEQACRLLREQADDVQADLHRAAIIQRALLPRAPPTLDRFHVHAFYRPSRSVGGDVYDLVALDDRWLAVVIADAAGHGLGAAMLAVLFRCQLLFADPQTRARHAPEEVLQIANRALCEALPTPGLFLTAAYCLLDTSTGRVLAGSAGHPPLLVLRSGGEIERVYHGGPALGLYPDAEFVQQELVLGHGDRLLLYSDGLSEALPGADDALAERLSQALRAGAEAGPVLRELVESASGEPLHDDVTTLLLSAQPGVSVLDNGTLPGVVPRPAGAVGARILRGEGPRGSVVSIEGRPDWTQSAAFHAECNAAIEGGREVTIDLTLCTYLDSSFLGTIHDLAQRADWGDARLRLQGVIPGVEKLFVELGMERVRERIVPRMLPIPTRMVPLADGGSDEAARALHLLRAHEGLANLSDANRRQFDPFITALRREIAGPSRRTRCST